MMLDRDRFLEVIEATPLVSIDLLLRNDEGQVLLGKRVNRPAQGYWFVPGGRIWKNERLRDALRRISARETGIVLDDARLVGAYDHFYPDNYWGVAGIETHYVVLAYTAAVRSGTPVTADEQHAALAWWDVPRLLASPEVHENTRRYFAGEP